MEILVHRQYHSIFLLLCSNSVVSVCTHLHFLAAAVTELIFEQWLTTLFEFWKDRVREMCLGSVWCNWPLPLECRSGDRHCPSHWAPTAACFCHQCSLSPDQQLLGHVRLSAVCLFTLHLGPSESTTMLQCAANINKVGLHDQDRLL